MTGLSVPPTVLPSNRREVYTNWARTAIEAVVEHESLIGGTVMLPAFICRDSFEPLFERLDLTPRFVDVELPSYHADFEQAQEQIEGVDAIFLVHAFGLPIEMDRWGRLAADHDCVLVEDCARSLGATVDGQPVGARGDYAVFSLQKVVPVSKGGILIGPDSVGDISLGQPTYGVEAVYNGLPMSIRTQLSVAYPMEVEPRSLDLLTKWAFIRHVRHRYEDELSRYRERAMQLKTGLEPLGFEFQSDHSGRIYQIVPAVTPCDRDELAHYLTAYHVPHKVTWGHPWAKTYAGAEFEDQYPNAAHLSDRIIQFKVSEMDDSDVEFAIERIRSFLNEFGR
jgi:dTDP-4-amino-4,6-dideoxygalactose transaminase